MFRATGCISLEKARSCEKGNARPMKRKAKTRPALLPVQSGAFLSKAICKSPFQRRLARTLPTKQGSKESGVKAVISNQFSVFSLQKKSQLLLLTTDY
jgi:hypothetical protein